MTVSVTNTRLVSRNQAGELTNGYSSNSSFSQDGQSVIFTSRGSTLVTGDTNNFEDVFVKNLSTGVVTRVSTSATGAQGNFIAITGSISPDGTQAMFSTFASNMVPNDTNGGEDVFLKNLVTGAVTPVSQGPSGSTGNTYSHAASFSGDGSKIVFATMASDLGPADTPGTSDIYVRDVETGSYTLVSSTSTAAANDFTDNPSISFDGNMVAFMGGASNLVPNDINGVVDVFVKNLRTGEIVRASETATGVQGNADSENAVISPDGTKVAFLSVADNLVADDTNGRIDIFVKDLITGEITRVSQTAAGVQGNGDSYSPAWSPDGHRIAFVTTSSNFGSTDTNGTQDIYIKDIETGELALVSRTGMGRAGNSYSVSPSFSADGTKITYTSAASDIVLGDHNGTDDIFTADIGGNPHIITGTQHNDTLNGTDGNDVIDGKAGYDKINLGGGHDVAWAGTGQSTLHGDDGNDILFGRGGHDRLHGDNGDDILRGGAGDDKLLGGEGNDKLHGDAGTDTIYGNTGNDAIWGEDGSDNLYGASGNDRLDGGADADNMHGGSGNDTLRGGTGNDTLYGDGSSDYLYGDDGDDTLYGGTGTNHLIGGGGADAFVINADAFDGHADKFDDFNAEQGDMLQLDNILAAFDPLNDTISDFISATQSGNNTFIAVDRDGAGAAHNLEVVAVLNHVTSVDIQDWYERGAIVVS